MTWKIFRFSVVWPIYERMFQNSVLEKQYKAQCARNVWQVESRKTKSEQHHIELTDLDEYTNVCVRYAFTRVYPHTQIPLS